MMNLASQVRSFMSGSLAAEKPAGEEEFNRLALEVFAFQREAVPVYRALCERRNAGADTIRHWSEIPPLPTRAFKEYEVSSIPDGERIGVFHSSGTTGQVPSRHFHSAESLSIYEASLLPWFARHFFTSQPAPMKLVFLTPETAPHSSLVHMFTMVRRHFGTPDSAFAGRTEADGLWSLDLEAILAAVREAVGENKPLGLLGTAFSFVGLLDHLQTAGKRFALPKGSRIMETGGYKGRTRTVPKAQLRQMMSKFLGVSASAVLAEYGMSELSSQAYESAGGIFHFPPWARARVVSPETGAEAGEGETGLLRVFDLANIGSVMAVQTEDLAVRREDGFELLGRAETAEPRGCSLRVKA
jgi:Acyl-protein synthetase, LuxE